MAKAPTFQMYVRDWLTATERLSLAAQGAWMRMCCHLHLARPRGELTLPLGGWARIMGCGKARARTLLDELHVTGTSHVTFGDADVTVMCRRMLRERNDKAASRLTTARWRARQEGDAEVTSPSSSASSSASATAKKPPLPPAPREGYSEGFEKWWAAYPKGGRKKGQRKCWKLWQREKLEARTDDILACLEAAKRSRDWKKERGQYIPCPHPWLNDAPWLTEDFAKDAADGAVPAFVPKMRTATPEDAWNRLNIAERQPYIEQAEKLLADRPPPKGHARWPPGVVANQAQKLWQQGRLRATAGAGKE